MLGDIRIKKVSEIVEYSGIKAILHGQSKSGKTYSISTIPGPESVLVLTAESGLLSLKKTGYNCDAIEIPSIDFLRDVYNHIKDDAKYKTIVLDSLSEIAEQVLSKQITIHKDPRKAYGELAETMVGLVKSFRDMKGKNVLMFCQQERIQDASGKIIYGPSMPGKQSAQKLPYLVDLVLCMRTIKGEDGKVRRAFQSEHDEIYECGDRSGLLDPFEKPSWEVVFDKINQTNQEK